jgi:hypothetical protein
MKYNFSPSYSTQLHDNTATKKEDNHRVLEIKLKKSNGVFASQSGLRRDTMLVMEITRRIRSPLLDLGTPLQGLSTATKFLGGSK